jgi:hypothetical protein
VERTQTITYLFAGFVFRFMNDTAIQIIFHFLKKKSGGARWVGGSVSLGEEVARFKKKINPGCAAPATLRSTAKGGGGVKKGCGVRVSVLGRKWPDLKKKINPGPPHTDRNKK